MTKEEAYYFINFFQKRVLGWVIVMSMVPGRGKSDLRTRRTREWYAVLSDFFINTPSTDDLVKCVMGGGDFIALWPIEFREMLEFELRHRVPIEHHEPLSSHTLEELGLERTPASLSRISLYVSEKDHPSAPSRSARYLQIHGTARHGEAAYE
jgi:hypothetical protein